jgi:hypothetical protein
MVAHIGSWLNRIYKPRLGVQMEKVVEPAIDVQLENLGTRNLTTLVNSSIEIVTELGKNTSSVDWYAILGIGLAILTLVGMMYGFLVKKAKIRGRNEISIEMSPQISVFARPSVGSVTNEEVQNGAESSDEARRGSGNH